jgi:rhodanese-related sulfurtransferase
MISKKDRILIDIRPFEAFSITHMKGSFHMDGVNITNFANIMHQERE